MTGLSLHAVDAATGRPAEGMRVRVLTAGGRRRVIAEGRLGADGTLDHPVVRTRLEAGLYEVVFVIADFVGAAGRGSWRRPRSASGSTTPTATATCR